MIDQGVTAALAACDALRSTNGDDSHNSGTGVRRTERANRECTYTDFLKCQPLPFRGTKGVASLSQWCERIKSVFYISNCAAKNQVKFATCTLHSVALTWWNTHVQTVGHEAAYESDKIEKYVGGLLDMIHGSVVASKPKTMQEAIEIATELMDKKVRTFADRETASKRKGCTLNLLNHPFNLDLMPVELGSFDAIISMDWLAKYQAVIVCAEKIVRIPWGNETVIIHGDVARAPYRLAPSEMKELAELLKKLSDNGFIRLSSSPWGASDEKEHEEHLKAILELLKKEELYAKFSKCEFWIPKVQFLGHVIDTQGIHVYPTKIESVKDWASPKSPTEIRQFLGLAGSRKIKEGDTSRFEAKKQEKEAIEVDF
nr:reverse transcriptase domain-containing protein [Tanacetum cinerariifolium]